MASEWFSTDELRELQELIDATGPRAKRLRAILLSVTRVLVHQQFLLADSSWRGRETADHRRHLSSLYPQHSVESLDEVQLLGKPITQFFQETNRAYHSDQTTTGGASDHAIVAKAQGGDFCMACGRRKNTVVDHIVSVNRGGSRNSLNNLQILCKNCNSAKKHLDEDLIRHLLTPSVSAKVSALVCYKHLVDTATDANGRRMGRCACGTVAKESQLVVRPFPRGAACTALTLRAYCDACSKK